MRIILGTVEGTTNKKGTKQNKVYDNVQKSNVDYFFNATDKKGNLFHFWNVNHDWSLLGIRRGGYNSRMSYTKNFKIED